MESKKQAGSSTSSSSSLDHLFGPKNPSSSSSSSSGIFGSIFSPPSTVPGRDSGIIRNQVGSSKYGNTDNMTQKTKGENSDVEGKEKGSVYQNEVAEPCYFSSSIFYGGQENYSPRTKAAESHHVVKKDGDDDDPNGNNSNGASRGNWWQGSLYY